MILLNLFWVSRIHDLDTRFGQAEMKELPGAPYSTTANKLLSGNTAALIRGLLTMDARRILPGAAMGHYAWPPSTIFYCANADKLHCNGS